MPEICPKAPKTSWWSHEGSSRRQEKALPGSWLSSAGSSMVSFATNTFSWCIHTAGDSIYCPSRAHLGIFLNIPHVLCCACPFWLIFSRAVPAPARWAQWAGWRYFCLWEEFVQPHLNCCSLPVQVRSRPGRGAASRGPKLVAIEICQVFTLDSNKNPSVKMDPL